MIPLPRKLIATTYSFLTLVAALGLLGCNGSTSAPRSSPPLAGSIGTASWSNFQQINPKAEIDEAHAVYAVFPPNRFAFVILVDFVGKFKGTDDKLATGRETKYIGFHEASDGRKVEWQWETADGKTGTMTINGSSYDLSAGALFLVSTRGGQVRVQQLQLDSGNVEADSPQQSLERLLRDDANMVLFIGEPPMPK